MHRQISFYHADLAEDEKRRRQLGWSKGDVKVCTVHPLSNAMYIPSTYLAPVLVKTAGMVQRRCQGIVLTLLV